MPLRQGMVRPKNLGDTEMTILLTVEGLVNTASTNSTEGINTVVLIPSNLYGVDVTENILEALKKMHASVGENIGFEKNENGWKFTIYNEYAIPFCSQR